MRRVVLLTLALAWAGAGTAAALELPSAEVSAYLSGTGGGSLIANSATNPPNETWSWQICDASGQSCMPAGAGRELETPATQTAGATFRATSNLGPSALSPVWNGPLHARAAPSVTGPVRANALVTPVPAVWEGGWTGDMGETQLSACPTISSSGCITLTSRGYGGGCPKGGAILDPDFVGWYLQLASSVYGPQVAFALPAFSSPYGEVSWAAGPATAVAVLSRIASAAGRRTMNCGPPPLVPGLPPREALRVSSAEIATDGLAIVHCSQCTVAIRAGSRRRQVSARASGTGEIELRIPHRRLARLGHGPVRLTLFVDGHPVARATIRRPEG